jgi:2-dehydro-3-deoxyphosphogluconate aldolase/(4S)-4-hydroxy-2-oxoglutarate aldolase
MSTIEAILRKAPVIPVLAINRVVDAVPIAQALVAGGLPVIEVSLRTPGALDAITAISQVPGAIVGAGMVVTPAELHAALGVGAAFATSPGLARSLGDAARAAGVPYLPGAANVSDIMLGIELGFSCFRFYPAEASGGIPALKAISAPFPTVRFCPIGGITHGTAGNWLALPTVLCVGGSWVVPKGTVDKHAIEGAARAARALHA